MSVQPLCDSLRAIPCKDTVESGRRHPERMDPMSTRFATFATSDTTLPMHSQTKQANESNAPNESNDSNELDPSNASIRNLGGKLDELDPFDAFVADEKEPFEFRDLPREPRPRWLVPLLLLVATLLSMTWAGISAWSPMHLIGQAFERGSLFDLRRHILANWYPGMLFAVSLTIILGAHELGHYFATRIYRIQSSLPIFIPFPISPTGTCGAVILMDGMRADKKQIFDIGLAGPLAGLVFAIPIAAMGLMYGEPPQTRGHSIQFGQPLAIQLLAEILPVQAATADLQARATNAKEKPELKLRLAFGPEFGPKVEIKQLASDRTQTNNSKQAGDRIEKSTAQKEVIRSKSISNEAMNPMLMAAWVGFLVTGLNMVPISQLDGGHVIFGLLGRRSRPVCWITYLGCICYVTYTSIRYGQPEYILMLLLIPLMGIAHPPSRDDNVSLGWARQIIGVASLTIPFLCIPMRPIIIL